VYLLYRLRPRSAAAERRNPMGGECEILSVGRLTKISGTNDGEVGGLDPPSLPMPRLGDRLAGQADDCGADEKLGFSVRHALEDQVVKAELQL